MTTDRNRHVLLALLSLGAAGGIGCVGPSTCDPVGVCGTATPAVIELGQEFDLAPGQIATLKGTVITVTFSHIVADSRCPTDVTCVWSGDAAAQLRVDLSDAELWSGQLHTVETPKTATADNHELMLVSVSPTPKSDRTIKPADYRVRLRLSAK